MVLNNKKVVLIERFFYAKRRKFQIMNNKNIQSKILGVHIICQDEKSAKESKDKMEKLFNSFGLSVRLNL